MVVVRFADGGSNDWTGDWGGAGGARKRGALEAAVREERGWGEETSVRFFAGGRELRAGEEVPPGVVLAQAAPRVAGGLSGARAVGRAAATGPRVSVWEHFRDEVRWLRSWAVRMAGVIAIVIAITTARHPALLNRELALLLWGGAGGLFFLVTAMVLFNKDRARDPPPARDRVTALPQ